MDPYLESPDLWSAVHSRLIVGIADDLVDHLSAKYRVEIEKRTYFSEENDSILVGIPDVAVVTGRNQEATNLGTTSATATIQPETVIVPLAEEVTERYLEIREVATGRVVTVLELLSPKNKRAGEGRVAYERKRNRILASTTHLVEVDLLRGGRSFPIATQNLGDYRILICHGDRRPTGELYAFSLRQPIPKVPIPLMSGEELPILDLQKLLNHVYERGRYHLAIDYHQPLQPSLSQEDQQWIESLLKG